jgi:hypothetical protein
MWPFQTKKKKPLSILLDSWGFSPFFLIQKETKKKKKISLPFFFFPPPAREEGKKKRKKILHHPLAPVEKILPKIFL